jgi:hypothetical protein
MDLNSELNSNIMNTNSNILDINSNVLDINSNVLDINSSVQRNIMNEALSDSNILENNE